MAIEQLFFELIQVILGSRMCLSHSPSAEEWWLLYDMAKKQSLIGICFAAVQRLSAVEDSKNHKPQTINLPEVLFLTWMGMAAKIQQRNEVVNRQCVELQAKLAADGFCGCVLKGQGVAQLYGENLMNLRQSGDIDVWVNASFEKIMRYVNCISPTHEVTHQHVHFHFFEDTEVELHFTPSELECFTDNSKLQKYYKSQERIIFDSKRLDSAECGFLTPTTVFNLVFQLSHIYRHLFGEGIGLRQVMDYYFLLKSSNSEEREEAYEIIKKTGMDKFCAALMYVLIEIFSMEDRLCMCDVNKNVGKVLLDDIVSSGNFGAARERISNDNWWKRTLRFTRQNAHLLRYYPSEVLWDPVWRLWHFVWRKRHGYE